MNTTIDSPKMGLIRNKDHRGMARPDISITMSTSEIRRFMHNSSETLASFKHSVMDESTTDVLTSKQKTNLLYGHFLEILQSRTNDSEVFETVQDLITDAMIRERLPLHDLDMEDQARLSKQILTEMRRGQIENAQSLCTHCGQSWRAAILEGWRLHHDPNYDQTNTDIKLAVDGNPHRDLWKKLAWMMAENKNLDEYTRANVGILCGHLESVLIPLGHSWVDLLWGYLKTQIDIRVEGEIRSCSTKSHMDMPEKYWNGKMSLEQIFEELSARKSDIIRMAAENPVNVVQKYLILDDIPELMRQIDGYISAGKIGSQMLRFLTHVVLFMRQIGRPHHEDVADRVIKAYVECLIDLGERQSVAFYTVAVPAEVQLVLYSKYLQTIHSTEDRKLALEEANNVGLDIHAVTCYTVESIRNEQLNENEQKQLCSYIGEGDLNKISALEWLTFYQEQRGELLWQANSMIRSFLSENKIECVRNTFKTVPQDSIQQIVTNYGSRDMLPYKEERIIRKMKVDLTVFDKTLFNCKDKF